jgi:LPS O-antigen subunit length determinant protein (WzzB/FepE family)
VSKAKRWSKSRGREPSVSSYRVLGWKTEPPHTDPLLARIEALEKRILYLESWQTLVDDYVAQDLAAAQAYLSAEEDDL